MVANVGLYAAVAARAVGPGGAVFAVEPDARSCALLRQTVALNRLANVHVVPQALGDRTGPGHLFMHPDNPGDHRIYDRQRARAAVDVELITLDELVERCSIPPIDVLKIDIQGAEALALAGMRDILTRTPRIRMIMEFWPWGITQAGGSPRGLLQELRQMDFDLYELDGDAGRITAVTDDAWLAAHVLERQHFNLLVQRRCWDPPVAGVRSAR